MHNLRVWKSVPLVQSQSPPILIDAKILTGNVMRVKTDERRMSRSDRVGLGTDDDRWDGGVAETRQTLRNHRVVVLWIFVIACWGGDLWFSCGRHVLLLV